jgi:hypothetical protein
MPIGLETKEKQENSAIAMAFFSCRVQVKVKLTSATRKVGMVKGI